MKDQQYSKLLTFLNRLEEAKIQYSLEHARCDAMMVTVVSPGIYWEIEFLDDGTIDVECYQSNGHIYDEDKLEELFAQFADEEPATNHESATAGK